MKCGVRPVAELTNDERAALRDLNGAVYPPEVVAAWPGRSIEWSARQWSVIVWDDLESQAVAHAGIVIRQARWKDCDVRVGGIGGVMTHPDFRGRGYARAAVNRGIEFFREQDDIDFGLLVCKPSLIPLYERLSWRVFAGDLFVEQHGKTVKFTFNVPMTCPLRLQEVLGGAIDLLGPPW
ncbi:MAG TPA: GNAT family N-acetyltransferase [Pirellulales bacterium]|nr:GNAT family N-acetyltransferase [Pirellulales bacterium]